MYVGKTSNSLVELQNKERKGICNWQLSANGTRLLCPPLTIGGHVIPIHTCKRSLPYMGFPYKGSATHLGAVWKIYLKQGNS